MSDRDDARFDDIHDLAAVYALDALDDTERVEFEVHLAGCETCRRQVDDFRATAQRLGEASATPPPPDLKRSVLAAVATTPQESAVERDGAAPLASVGGRASSGSSRRRARTSQRRWMVPIGIAAALVLVVSAAVVVMNAGGDDVTIADVRSADDVVISTLAGEAGDGAELVVSWSPGLGWATVEGADVAAAGQRQVYEMWAIVAGTPVAAGLIEHDGGAMSELFEVDESDVEAWGVTIEPAGGSQVPTLPILYFGEV